LIDPVVGTNNVEAVYDLISKSSRDPFVASNPPDICRYASYDPTPSHVRLRFSIVKSIPLYERTSQSGGTFAVEKRQI
jgi:hypothetical protein